MSLKITSRIKDTTDIDINKQDAGGKTLLHYAVIDNKPDKIRFLLSKNAKTNIKDNYGNAPLHYAVLLGDRNVFLLLIKFCTVNIRNNFLHTPMHLAALTGNELAIIILIKSPKIKINARDLYGRTPLFIASYRGHENIVKLLVNNNANLEIKSKAI